MNDIININNDVFVEIKRKENRTIVVLDRNGERVVLSNLKTSEGFRRSRKMVFRWCN